MQHVLNKHVCKFVERIVLIGLHAQLVISVLRDRNVTAVAVWLVIESIQLFRENIAVLCDEAR